MSAPTEAPLGLALRRAVEADLPAVVRLFATPDACLLLWSERTGEVEIRAELGRAGVELAIQDKRLTADASGFLIPVQPGATPSG